MKNLLIIFTVLLFACNPTEERLRYSIERKYEHSVYPEDTSFVGKVVDIKSTRIKKFGDVATVKSNNIYILSNNNRFLINMREPCFKVGDSVGIEVQRVKGKYEMNGVKTIIYPKFGASCETYGITNETAREKMNDELKKLHL